MDSIEVRAGERIYSVTFGNRLDHWLETVLPVDGALPSLILLLVDENVWRLHGPRLERAFAPLQSDLRVIEVPAGESTKTLEVYGQLCDKVLACGPDRATPLVACGGGVTGDAAGFVAATVLRGLPLYQVPTTTLAQADSGVGGKVGLNHTAGKNLLGAFHQPRAVFIDPSFTETLDDRNYLAGLFEGVKMGLVLDERLYRFTVNNWAGLEARGRSELLHLLQESCRLKARVVELDELEQGPRRVLNFGHTAGHVLERLSGDGLRHGEAVAWGMAAALDLSVRYAGLAPEEATAASAFITGPEGLPRPQPPEREPFLRLLEMDKKRRGAATDFVLLRALGRTEICRSLDGEEIWQATLRVMDEGRAAVST